MEWSHSHINWLIGGILFAIYVAYFFWRRKQKMQYQTLLKNRLVQDNQLVEEIRHADWLTQSFSEIEIAGKHCFYNVNSFEKDILFLKAVHQKYRIGRLVRWASHSDDFDHISLQFPEENLSLGVETGFFYTEIPKNRVENWKEEYERMNTFLSAHQTTELGIDNPISLEEYMALLDSKKSLLEY